MLPAVHPAPADFALGGESLSKALGNRAGFAESLGDTFRVSDGILRPFRRAAGRVDANNSILANADVAELFCNRTGFAQLRKEVLALVCRPHRRASARRRPHGSDKRSNDEVSLRNAIGKTFEIVVGGVDTHVRLE